jgi:hypothetical protein
MEFHTAAAAKEIALGNPEGEGIADLAGGTGDHDVDGSAAAHGGSEVVRTMALNLEWSVAVVSGKKLRAMV